MQIVSLPIFNTVMFPIVFFANVSQSVVCRRPALKVVSSIIIGRGGIWGSSLGLMSQLVDTNRSTIARSS